MIENLLKAALYFPIQPGKIRKSQIFTTFEKIHCSFLNNLKSEETKSQIKAHLSYLANSYFYNYKPSPRILHQHRVLWNLCKNKDIIITKPQKGNGVIILDRKLYYNAIEEIISDTSKFEKLYEDPTFKREASLQHFLHNLKQKMKFNMINCIQLVTSMVLLKCTNSTLVIYFLNFVWLFLLQVLLIIILPISFVILSHL